MALIKCSECGMDVSDKATLCPKCGCPLEVTKQVISDSKRTKHKKIIILVVSVIIIFAIILAGVFIGKYYNEPQNIAIRLIKKILVMILRLKKYIIIRKLTVVLLNF